MEHHLPTDVIYAFNPDLQLQVKHSRLVLSKRKHFFFFFFACLMFWTNKGLPKPLSCNIFFYCLMCLGKQHLMSCWAFMKDGIVSGWFVSFESTRVRERHQSHFQDLCKDIKSLIFTKSWNKIVLKLSCRVETHPQPIIKETGEPLSAGKA